MLVEPKPSSLGYVAPRRDTRYLYGSSTLACVRFRVAFEVNRLCDTEYGVDRGATKALGHGPSSFRRLRVRCAMQVASALTEPQKRVPDLPRLAISANRAFTAPRSVGYLTPRKQCMYSLTSATATVGQPLDIK